MGYATVLNVPRVTNYEMAKRIHDETKPIRGTTVIPLGDRRDHHQYSIRKQGNQDIELVCYKTPVVTFHPDDTVTIQTDGWTSVSTHQFIQQVLGIPTNRRGRFTVMRLGDSVVSISGGDTATLYRGEDGNWHCSSAIVRPSYRMNRKGANSVRARYKDFINYIKGFSKVRAELVSPRYGRDYMGIQFSYDELNLVLEKDRDGDLIWRGTAELMQRSATNHKMRGEEMIEWVTSGDHEQYLKAALHMYAHDNLNYLKDPNRGHPRFYHDPMARPADIGPKNFDEFILRWHAEEVIEQCETKPNAVPNMKYAEWLNPKKENNT